MIYLVALGFSLAGASTVTCTPACTDGKSCLPKESDNSVGECRKKEDPGYTPENWTNLINFYRCLHGQPQVQWELKLVEQAKEYIAAWKEANKDKGNDDQIVWPREPNFSTSEFPSIRNRAVYTNGSAAKVVNLWYNELAKFTFSNNPSLDSLQFTAMVWKSSTHVGCHVDGMYIVCSLHAAKGPIPNTRGKFVEEVGEQDLTAKGSCIANSGNVATGDFEIKTMTARKTPNFAHVGSVFYAISLLFVVM